MPRSLLQPTLPSLVAAKRRPKLVPLVPALHVNAAVAVAAAPLGFALVETSATAVAMEQLVVLAAKLLRPLR